MQAGTGLASGGAHCEPACDEAPPNRMRSADLDALGDFMRSLRTMHRSPHLKPSGTLDRPAMRGQAIFFSTMTGCAGCHPPPLFTDRSKHDVGTGRGASERKGTSFDTPSLRFLFSSAPYLHDGSAPSLRDVVTTGNPGDLHGRTSHLSSGEVDDLVAFLESIPFGTARRRAVRSAP
ncbi:MAG: hypothetical protein ACXW5U_03315 [Thermoanaerobaculia bacterium]